MDGAGVGQGLRASGQEGSLCLGMSVGTGMGHGQAIVPHETQGQRPGGRKWAPGENRQTGDKAGVSAHWAHLRTACRPKLLTPEDRDKTDADSRVCPGVTQNPRTWLVPHLLLFRLPAP